MFKKILYGADGSDASLKAARVAAEIAVKFGAELTALHVNDPPVALYPGLDGSAYLLDPVATRVQTEAISALVESRTRETLDQLHAPYTVKHVSGHPAHQILTAAKEEAFDLIVLGSRGAGALESFLLGSVTDRVAHHAPCAVMIVR